MVKRGSKGIVKGDAKGFIDNTPRSYPFVFVPRRVVPFTGLEVPFEPLIYGPYTRKLSFPVIPSPRKMQGELQAERRASFP